MFQTSLKAVSETESHIPPLHCLNEVCKLLKGRSFTPDAKTVHVGHVPWLRCTWNGDYQIIPSIGIE